MQGDRGIPGVDGKNGHPGIKVLLHHLCFLNSVSYSLSLIFLKGSKGTAGAKGEREAKGEKVLYRHSEYRQLTNFVTNRKFS